MVIDVSFFTSRSCFEAFTENMTGETQLLELRRQLHCASYNCAIALICCSFNETKFYQGFLFTEKPEKVSCFKMWFVLKQKCCKKSVMSDS